MQRPTYTVRQLAELAGVLAQVTPTAAPHRHISQNALAAYWVTSQCRMERWNRFLHHAETSDPLLAGSNQDDRTRFLDWVEEILVSEMATRLATALTAVTDRRHGTQESEPIARRVFLNHQEVRRRLLKLLVTGHAIDPAAGVSVNQTRRRVERWTDLLIGYVMQLDDVSEFAFSPERAADHLEGLRYESKQAQGHYTWPLVLSSLRSTFSGYENTWLPNQELDARVELSILATCGADQVDSVGIFSAFWQSRLDHYSDDAEVLLQQLMD